MKNIITILLILILPVSIYLFLSRNSQNISAMASDKNNPNILIFTSTMCLDCKKMKEVIKEVEPGYNTRINFIHINALDKNRKVQEYVKKHHVVLVPTIVFTDTNGKETEKLEGFIPKEELITEIEDAING